VGADRSQTTLPAQAWLVLPEEHCGPFAVQEQHDAVAPTTLQDPVVHAVVVV